MKDFPVLKKKVNGKRLVYLDSAATSLTPGQVVQSIVDYYEKYNANIHRGIHQMSQEATELYEKSHEKIAKFINSNKNEIIFTKNTTESLNLLAYSLCFDFNENDNIVLTEMEHHSNIVPWQQLFKGEIRYVPVVNGELDISKMKKMIDENTKVISVVHASNVLGTVNPISEISKIKKNALLIVDGAQSVPHMPIDVKKLGVDFFAFSGHKMLGPTGIGVLYGRESLLEKMKPFLYGGDMIKEVTLEKTTFNDLPWKFEAGTPNIADAIALGEAVDYLEKIGMQKVFEHGKKLAMQTIKILQKLGAEVYGTGEIGVVSFNFPKIHPHDVSEILDQSGIAIRGGHNCAMPLHKTLGVNGSCRASFHIYNTEEDVLELEKGLKKVLEVFK